MGQIVPTASFFSNGVTEVAGQTKQYRVKVTGTWLQDDQLVLLANDTLSGLQTLIGAGNVTGKEPVYLFTFKKKMYLIVGTAIYFSVLNDPTSFNRLVAAGNGFIEISNSYATPENLVALRQFNGKLAIFGRNSTVISSVSPDPNLYNEEQILDNVGTFAPLSVQAKGELDVMYLQEHGIRSIRARHETLNAYPDDVGSAIDLAVIAKLAECTTAEAAAACGIHDVQSGRYWLFIKDTIFVLSDYLTAKVRAWSTYEATYQTADLMRLSNGSGAALDVKLGMTSDVTEATQTYLAMANGTTQVITPAAYVFTSAAGAGVWTTTAISDGVSFRGNIAVEAVSATLTPNETAFVPLKFITFNGKTYANASDAIYAYGGSNGRTYDNTVATIQLPWLDANTSDVSKRAGAIIASMTQTWDFFASMDYTSEEFVHVLSETASETYDGGQIPFASTGTHFSFIATCADTDGGKLSALTLIYDE